MNQSLINSLFQIQSQAYIEPNRHGKLVIYKLNNVGWKLKKNSS